MSMTIGGTQIAFPDASTQNTAATGFGFKNRIINGAMVIDQRNAGASVTPSSSTYLLDRWQCVTGVQSKFSYQQSTTAPAGFKNSFLATVVAAYSETSGDFHVVQQQIEGNNTYDLGWGAAGAAAVTLSFWVRCSLTGTFGGYLTNADNTRTYPFTYTVSAANTWEQKSVTIAGDTSGTWATGITTGIQVGFSLGAGSTYTGAAGSWATATYLGATGQTNVVATAGATFYITGVQLEKGSTATSFDYRPYGTELALCQRYYYQIGGNSVVGTSAYTMFASGMLWNTGSGDFCVPFKVSMRSAPSITYSASGVAIQYQTTQAAVTGQSTVDGTTTNTAFMRMTTAQSWGSGGGCNLCANTSTTAYVAFSSEL